MGDMPMMLKQPMLSDALAVASTCCSDVASVGVHAQTGDIDEEEASVSEINHLKVKLIPTTVVAVEHHRYCTVVPVEAAIRHEVAIAATCIANAVLPAEAAEMIVIAVSFGWKLIRHTGERNAGHCNFTCFDHLLAGCRHAVVEKDARDR
jgi:hypothetical protein